MTTPLNVAILAAGQGKRMHSAQPKVLHPLAGRPLAAHVIDTMRGLAPRAIAVVIGHGAGAVQTALSASDLAFVQQEPPRGTGDATRVALTVLPGDGITLVGLADVPLVPASGLAAIVEHARRGDVGLLTARVANPSGLGRIVRDASGGVRRIVEERDASATERAIDEINTGFIAAPTALLSGWVAQLTPHNAQGEFYLTDIVAMAVAEGVPVSAHVAADEREVRGVNDRAQLAFAERLLQTRRAHALLEAGTWIADPARIDLRGSLACGRDVRIDVGCVFEGNVKLADDVEIGAYCVLRDVTIGAGTSILPYSHLEDAEVGAHCRIGPYSRLRPGAALADEVHVGNFVEIKASTLGRGSKANHLAYIGDAVVGRDVNYGAGAITANYDGANKHKTIIGDNARVGSNCVLVAPITIGAGATIGGGSTVVREAPADALTLARAPQVSVPGWKRPVKKLKDVK
ncbi:MAG: bifunctional UDP-N-acetylglucosamine diphosphorylase/glucosamine-1-phosphate N-acetyltransferase GlmU [Casimicrobiaceae bacterium]